MVSNKLNFIFFGTPDVASETLEILKNAGYMPSLIVTASDRPQGRKMIITPPPVKVWAEENNIPFLQPEKLDTDFIESLKPKCLESNCLFIVVAYGKILPESIISMPTLGTINIHYSLLPRYRGASPVESAILNEDTETGISIQQMEFKMDTGPILAEEKVSIGPNEKAPELRKRLIKLGGDLLVNTLPNITDKKISAKSQDENKATYCKKMTKDDGLIDLSDDGVKNYNKFRAYFTWPGTYFIARRSLPAGQAGLSAGGFVDKRVIIKDAELIDSVFKINRVIPEGRKEISFEEFKKQN